jgi:hypothetical protein
MVLVNIREDKGIISFQTNILLFSFTVTLLGAT